MRIAGFDIGGANSDLAIINFDDYGNVLNIKTKFKYLPMWIKKDELEMALLELLGNDRNKIDAVGVCMTAELVDAYKTKKEGVLDIARKIEETFSMPIGFVGLEGMLSFDKLLLNPLKVAAANWIATAELASRISNNCIIVDVGSTTTDIIPIKNGSECAAGRSDLERLGTGELVYTGALRTNIATLIYKVPFKGHWLRVSSELFAITADIHLVLGNISKNDYTCSSPDGAGKSRSESIRRISRVVCGDMDVLSTSDVFEIAKYIYKTQVKQISKAVLEVSKREGISKVVTTGLGMDFLAAEAAKKAKIPSIGMDKLIEKKDCIVAPAVGTALLMEKFLKKH
ncbi:MAG: H4MPT-linked C1 transfer pathway protein [Euryarchaeota archaeon]|nr:H4MPT-linked C1 transfer pathway protein [Euryarchaeota archaeon]